MTTRRRAPRPPQGPKRKLPKAKAPQAQGLVDALVGEHVELEVVPTPVDLIDVRICRKAFTLNGRRYKPGDPVPVASIPRLEGWIRTGFIREEKVQAPVGQDLVRVAS